jgi:hypothetical protein
MLYFIQPRTAMSRCTDRLLLFFSFSRFDPLTESCCLSTDLAIREGNQGFSSTLAACVQSCATTGGVGTLEGRLGVDRGALS